MSQVSQPGNNSGGMRDKADKVATPDEATGSKLAQNINLDNFVSLTFRILDHAFNYLARNLERAYERDSKCDLPSLPRQLRSDFFSLLKAIKEPPVYFTAEYYEENWYTNIAHKLTELIEAVANLVDDFGTDRRGYGPFQTACKSLINLLLPPDVYTPTTFNDILAGLRLDGVLLKSESICAQSKATTLPTIEVAASLLEIVSILKELYSELPEIASPDTTPDNVASIFDLNPSQTLTSTQMEILQSLAGMNCKLTARAYGPISGSYGISISMAIPEGFADSFEEVTKILNGKFRAVFKHDCTPRPSFWLRGKPNKNSIVTVYLPLSVSEGFHPNRFSETARDGASSKDLGRSDHLIIPIKFQEGSIPVIFPKGLFRDGDPDLNIANNIASGLKFLEGQLPEKSVVLIDKNDLEQYHINVLSEPNTKGIGGDIDKTELFRRQLQAFFQDPGAGVRHPPRLLKFELPLWAFKDDNETSKVGSTLADIVKRFELETHLQDSLWILDGADRLATTLSLILKELDGHDLPNAGEAKPRLKIGSMDDSGQYFYVTDSRGGLLLRGIVKEGEEGASVYSNTIRPEITAETSELIRALEDGIPDALKGQFGRAAALHNYLSDRGFYLAMELITLLLDGHIRHLGVVCKDSIASLLYSTLANIREPMISHNVPSNGRNLRLVIGLGDEDLLF
jgi:hypothetical protein